MTEIYIEDMNEIVDLITEESNHLERYDSLSVIAFYEDMAEILKLLLRHDDFMIANIELYDGDFNGYDKEYILSLSDDEMIWVQPLHSEAGYVNYDSKFVFVADDCSREVLDYNSCREACVYSFGYGEESECGCEGCSNCTCEHENDEDDMHGFTVSSSDRFGSSTYSFYSTEIELVKEEVKDIIEKLNKIQN